MPHPDPEQSGPDLPGQGWAALVPPPGGMERLLAKRARRGRVLHLESWLPAVACAASLILMSLVLRGPRLDVESVRSQFTSRGVTLQLEDSQRVLQQRAVADGVHIYTVRGR